MPSYSSLKKKKKKTRRKTQSSHDPTHLGVTTGRTLVCYLVLRELSCLSVCEGGRLVTTKKRREKQMDLGTEEKDRQTDTILLGNAMNAREKIKLVFGNCES